MLPWNNTLQQCHRTVYDYGQTTVRMLSSGILLERLSQGTHEVGDMAYKVNMQLKKSGGGGGQALIT